jgi:AcrR family transcriptional regulator
MSDSPTLEAPTRAASAATNAVEVRERILGAARARFERYGFNKTTMNEIAGDCAMSAANIYRYFPNKGEIVAEGARRWLGDSERALRDIAGRAALSPAERLRRMVAVRLARMAELVSRHPHLDELIDHVCQQQPDLLADYTGRIRALVADVLDDGARAGDFAFADAAEAAATIEAATAMFHHHGFVRQLALEDLERDADRVMALLLRGLAKGTDG